MSELFQSAPERGERFLLREWVGHLCLFTPRQFRESVPMPNGDADVIEGDVVVLTAQPVQSFTNTWVLGKYVVPRLREAIGGVPVLARVEIVPGSEKRDRPAHQLGPFTPQDAQFAEQYIRSQPTVQPVQQYGAPVPLPNTQQHSYSNPSPERLAELQQQYAPAPVPTAVSTYPAQTTTPTPAPLPTPAPAPSPPAPAQHPLGPPPQVHGTPVQPQHQLPGPAPAQDAPAPSGALSEEQLANLPAEVRAMLLGQGSNPPPQA